MKNEKTRRDEVLDQLELWRAPLITVAKIVACELEQKNGRVTSPEVIRELKLRGYEAQLEEVDKRFMGAVFRKTDNWERVGWEPIGSHARPVSVWKRRRNTTGNTAA